MNPVLEGFVRLLCASVRQTLPVHFALTVAFSVFAMSTVAQDLAPTSLAGQILNITILSGSAPFTSSGDYKLFTSPLNNNFTVILGC